MQSNAIPMGLYAEIPAVNETLLQALGFSEEDVPTTWPQMLDMLARLSDGRMQNIPEASLLDPGYTMRGAKNHFLTQMMDNYMLWLDADEERLQRAGEVLGGLLDAFDQIDWAGFGLPEKQEDAFEFWTEDILFSQCALNPRMLEQDDSTGVRPLPLAVAENEDARIGAEVSMAFVNPFSTHRDAAIEYLEAVVSHLDQETLIKLCPLKNEPVERSDYQEQMEAFDRRIAEAEEQILQADEREDDEAIAALQEELKRLLEEKEQAETSERWEVSPGSIALYRVLAESIVPSISNWWTGEDSVYSRLTQYIDGAIPASQLAMELEKLIEMKRFEEM